MSERKIQNDGGSGYTCVCGVYHKFPLYVYAHPRDVLVHTCDCGQKVSIIMRHAAAVRKRGRPKTLPTQADANPTRTNISLNKK